VVGAGGLARSFLPGLVRAGYPIVAVAARSAAHARRAARLAPGASATTSAEDAAREASLVLLAVPDRALRPVAERLARDRKASWDRTVVLHHAGALGVEPLAPLARRGAAVGVLHPLQCLGLPSVAAALLAGSWARVEGDPRAATAARRLARDLGLRLLPSAAWSSADRAAYHAAASLVANDLVGLLSAAAGLLREIGVPARTADAALVRLARGALAQAETAGLAGALTGPVARGDAETLTRQIQRIAASSPGVAEAHRLICRQVLALARAHRTLSPAEARSVAAVLDRSGLAEAPPRGGRGRRTGV
jgi:predicted short-subunit dehydrogenase-like oxidoreductase (DUF2520 family)